MITSQSNALMTKSISLSNAVTAALLTSGEATEGGVDPATEPTGADADCGCVVIQPYPPVLGCGNAVNLPYLEDGDYLVGEVHPASFLSEVWHWLFPAASLVEAIVGAQPLDTGVMLPTCTVEMPIANEITSNTDVFYDTVGVHNNAEALLV